MKSLLPRLSLIMVLLLGWGLLATAQSFVYEENANNQGFKIQSSTKNLIKIEHAIHSFELLDVQVQGEGMKQLLYGLSLVPAAEGTPDVRSEARYVLIPNGAQVKLNIMNEEKMVYENVNLAPAAAIPFDTKPALPPVKGTAYQKDMFFPGEVAQASITSVRGMTMAVINMSPFQYNPVTKELVVYKNLKIELQITGGDGQYGSDRFRNKYWDQILDDLVANNNELPKMDYSKRETHGKDVTGCEYLIIVPNNADFLPWADSIKLFRTEQGIPTEIVTIDEIGGNTVDNIKNYIDNVYETWDPVPAGILLMADYGNDANTITSKIYPHPYEGNLITDNYFADYTGNDLPDFVMARMTGRNYAEIETMVTKFLEYERTPPSNSDFYNKPITALGWQTERWFQICSETVGGYMKNVLGKEPVRINAVYDGNPNSDPWSTATNTAQVVNYFGPMGQGYIPATPAELGGFSGGTANGVVAAINDGAFILQHRDHGMESGWGEPAFTMSYISQLNNVDELCHIFSINCLTGRFDVSGECFAEKFHRYTNGGALSLTAASQVSYSFVNDAYVWGMFDNMWSDFMPDYGGNLVPEREFRPAFGNASGKYFLSTSNWPYNGESKQITYRLFHHHGDVFGIVYTEVPEEMEVAYSDVLISGPDFIDIQAEEGALIAFSVDGALIGSAIATGNADAVTIEPQIPGTMIKVVVTKQNFYRHQGYIQVIAPDGPYVVKSGFEIIDNEGNANGLVDFGETVHLDFSVKNLGTEMASNVVVTIATDNEYVTLNDASESFGDVAVNEEVTREMAFNFDVNEEIPDNQSVQFNFSATNGTDVWESTFSLKAYAPVLEIGNMQLTEVNGNGNGRIDAGEEFIIIILMNNSGHSDSREGLSTISSNSDYLTIISSEYSFAPIDSAGFTTAEFHLQASEDTPVGVVIEVVNNVACGTFSLTKTFNFSVGLIVEDWETGDFSQFGWNTTGNANWVIDNMVYYEGVNSARSGNIGDSQISSLTLNYDVMVDNEISFYYKVSSESGYDYLKFFIDNVEQGSWSGEAGWELATYPVTAGPHEFKWKYSKDGSVDSGQDCAWVDFIVLPPMLLPTSNAGPDAEVCHTTTDYQLAGTATDYESLEWSTSGDGTFSALDILNPLYTIGTNDLANGSVVLTLTAYGSNGNSVNNMVLNISTDPQQPEIPQGEANVCHAAQGVIYQVNAVESNYLWTITPAEAAEIVANGASAQLSFNEDFSGEAQISVAALNACGESAPSENLVITVNEVATAAFEADVETCFGNEANITLNLTGATPWTVEVTDENGLEFLFQAETSPYDLAVSPDSTMVYTLVSVSDALGCSGMASGTVQVVVNELPSATLEVNDAEVCSGSMIVVDLSLTGENPWSVVLGDGNGLEQTYEVNQAVSQVEFMAPAIDFTLQFVQVSDANGCNGEGIGEVTISINAAPVVDLGADTIVCHNINYLLDAGNAGSTYLWSTGETTQTISVTEAMANEQGDLLVNVLVNNELGCENLDEVTVHFKDCTGIDEKYADKIMLSPNPNNGLFSVELGDLASQVTDIAIYNSLGEVVYQTDANAQSENIHFDLSHLANGVYHIIISIDNEKINKRFVIRKL